MSDDKQQGAQHQSEEEQLDSDALLDLDNLDIPLDDLSSDTPSHAPVAEEEAAAAADDFDNAFAMDDLPDFDAPGALNEFDTPAGEEKVALDELDELEPSSEYATASSDLETPDEIEDELESLLSDWDNVDAVELSDAAKAAPADEAAVAEPAPEPTPEPTPEPAPTPADELDNDLLDELPEPPDFSPAPQAQMPMEPSVVPEPSPKPSSQQPAAPETTKKESKALKSKINLAGSLGISVGLIALLVAGGAAWMAMGAKQQALENAAAPQKMALEIKEIRQQMKQNHQEAKRSIKKVQAQLDALSKVVASRSSDQWRATANDRNEAPKQHATALATTPQQPAKQAVKPAAVKINKQVITPAKAKKQTPTVVRKAARHVQSQHPTHSADKGWAVNILSVSRRKDARQELAYLKQHGIDAEAVQIRVHGKRWFRLRKTGYADKHAARQGMRTIKRKLAKRKISPWSEPASWINRYRVHAVHAVKQLPHPPSKAATAPKSASATKPAAKPAPAPAPHQPAQQHQRWVVNIISMETEAAAKQEVKRLRANNIRAEYVRIPVNNKVWYRVRVGGFESEQDAVAYEKFLKSYHGLNAWHVKMK